MYIVKTVLRNIAKRKIGFVKNQKLFYNSTFNFIIKQDPRTVQNTLAYSNKGVELKNIFNLKFTNVRLSLRSTRKSSTEMVC